MARRRYLVMYDISDDRRLRLVHDVVRSHGTRFQYSVYLCDLSAAELVSMRWQVGEVMDQSHDALAIVDLGPTDQVRRSTFEFLGRQPPMPPTRSTVI